MTKPTRHSGGDRRTGGIDLGECLDGQAERTRARRQKGARRPARWPTSRGVGGGPGPRIFFEALRSEGCTILRGLGGGGGGGTHAGSLIRNFPGTGGAGEKADRRPGGRGGAGARAATPCAGGVGRLRAGRTGNIAGRLPWITAPVVGRGFRLLSEPVALNPNKAGGTDRRAARQAA